MPQYPTQETPAGTAHTRNNQATPSGRGVGGERPEGAPGLDTETPPPPPPPPQTPSRKGTPNGTGRPPPPTPEQNNRQLGRTSGGARTTWNGPTSNQNRCHATGAPGGGGGYKHGAPGASTRRPRQIMSAPSQHIMQQSQEGPPDRGRGTHRPRGMATSRHGKGNLGGRHRNGKREHRGNPKVRHHNIMSPVLPAPPPPGRVRRENTNRVLRPPTV